MLSLFQLFVCKEVARVIIVKLMGASGLPESGGLVSPDPYVELAMRPGDFTAGDQAQRSTSRPRTTSPRWFLLLLFMVLLY